MKEKDKECAKCGETKSKYYFEHHKSTTCKRCKADEKIEKYSEAQIEKRDNEIAGIKILLKEIIEAYDARNKRRLEITVDKARKETTYDRRNTLTMAKIKKIMDEGAV